VFSYCSFIRYLGTILYNNECCDSTRLFIKLMCFESVVPTAFNISGLKVRISIVNDFYDHVISVECMSNISETTVFAS
jgi:hypothetical protein